MNENQQPQQIETNEVLHECYQDGFNIVDILSPLWEQRWFIAGITVLFAAAAFIYLFIRTPLYEISAQIAPGITDFDEDGEAVRKLTPNDIVAWFSEEAYVDLVDDSVDDPPEIKAKIIPRTNSVRLVFFYKNPAEGEKFLSNILHGIIQSKEKFSNRELNLRKSILEQKINAEKQEINMLLLDQKRINSVDRLKINNEIENAENKIKLLEKKNDIVRKNRNDVQLALESSKNKIRNINKNTHEMMAIREQMVKEDADKVQLLMYSNIIQQNISFANNLQEQLLDLKKEIHELIGRENDHKKQIDYLETQIRSYKLDRDELNSIRDNEIQIDIENSKITIETLKLKLMNLSTIEINILPVSSKKPEKPNKVIVILMGFLLGIVIAIFIAYLRHYISNYQKYFKTGAVS